MGVASGKFTVGLGQTQMAFCDDREGSISVEHAAIQPTDSRSLPPVGLFSIPSLFNLAHKVLNFLELRIKQVTYKAVVEFASKMLNAAVIVITKASKSSINHQSVDKIQLLP